jgi:CCR4-NOT transcription complex subunit 2
VLVSPLADAPVRADLDFEVPACYKRSPPRLQPGYLAKFKEETLFYIFYSMPQVCVRVCFGGGGRVCV